MLKDLKVASTQSILLTSLTTLILIRYAVTESCACLNSSTLASWSQTDRQALCVSCQSSPISLKRSCKLATGEDTLCDVKLPCTFKDTCEGKWSTWSNAKKCNSTCGPGTQLQSRTCYKKTIINSRSDNCLNGNSAKEEYRMNSCRKSCNPTTAILLTSAGGRKRVTVISSTQTLLSTNETTTTSVSDFKSPTQSSRNLSGNPFEINQILLIAIISSVSIICITAVIIVIIVSRKCCTNHSRNTAVSKSKNNEENKTKFLTSTYESVPIPPSQKSSLHLPNDARSPSVRLSVKNVAYSSGKEDEYAYALPEEEYLKPISSPTADYEVVRENVPEGTYVTIEDCFGQNMTSKKQTKV